MQILKETGIDWRERRLISNLYMAQSVKVRLNRGETRSVKIHLQEHKTTITTASGNHYTVIHRV
jgi:hypothetical protein